MLRRTTIKTSMPVLYMKEADAFICYSPAFDLVPSLCGFDKF